MSDNDLADLFEPELCVFGVDVMAHYRRAMSGSLAVRCSDRGTCDGCNKRWPNAGWRPITDVRCAAYRCPERDDLKVIGGVILCEYHRWAPRLALQHLNDRPHGEA